MTTETERLVADLQRRAKIMLDTAQMTSQYPQWLLTEMNEAAECLLYAAAALSQQGRDAAVERDAATLCLLETIETNGDWDDGCFYYSGISASELQGPILRLRAALATQPKDRESRARNCQFSFSGCCGGLQRLATLAGTLCPKVSRSFSQTG